MKTNEKIIQTLKSQGEMTAKALAEQLGLTTMGIRQHMLSMETAGTIAFKDKKAPRGRPTRYWSLTEKSNEKFTDRHSELTVQLIDSVQSVLGSSALEKLIADREDKMFEQYQAKLEQGTTIKEKLELLAEIRSDEGYMATVVEQEGELWLMENHCPICAAATKCQNFCRSELQLFQKLFDDLAIISREEHIVEGSRRCAYRVLQT